MSALYALQQDALDRAGLQFYWDNELPLNQNESVTGVWLIEDALYYITNQQRLFCYDPVVGMQRWSYTVPERSFIYPPCHGPDINITPRTIGIQGLVPQGLLETATYKPVVVNTTRVVYLLDRVTGRELRRIDVQPDALATGVALDARYVFAALLDGSYVSFDLQEGVRTGWKGTITDGRHGVIQAAPQYLDGHVYVAATNGSLHCRVVDDKGRLEWSKNLVASIAATPLVNRSVCLVPVSDGRLYAFEPLTGQSKWFVPFTAGRALVHSPQAGTNTIFQFARGDRFYALDPERGKERWNHPTATTVLAIFQNVVYAVAPNNRDKHRPGFDLLALTEVTGEVRHEVPMTGLSLFAPNTSHAAIYAANANGRIVCIRPVSAGRITAEMLR
jgi:outer membrane protein assembly factor BamB